jgi:competence protein ComEC
MGRFLKYSALALLGLSLGFLRVFASQHDVTPYDIDYYNGQKLEVTGVITETDIRRDKAKYTVSAEGDFEGKVLISLNKYPQYKYGDRVRLWGELQAPGEFNGFDYGAYLSRFGIYSVMYHPSVEVLESGQGNLFWHGMSFLQGKFMERINRLFPEPHASFEAGLLVGARKGIPESLMEKFNITGLTHIIAISGYNITIIIVFVMWMLGGLPRMTGFAVACVAIVLFTLFVGASPAVVRASIMGILGLIALNYGRQNNIHLTILWSAALMVAWNPKILMHDVGFQLSFAAVMGLIYVAPHFEKFSKKLPQAFGVREAITMTLAAQVMALPIIVYNFERLSLIAPIANVLVIFAIPPAMLFGFVAVVLSFFFFPLAQVVAYMAWGILSYIIKIIEVTASIPYASINLPGMTLIMMIGYYALLMLVLVKLAKARSY